MKVLISLLIVSLTLSKINQCDIVVLGGTLASLGAVIHAPNQYSVCLIQPTQRVGGQLGQEGVWHIDFNWLYQQGYPDKTIAYNQKNIHPLITQIINKCNTGDCWVSKNCFLYNCIQPIFNNYLQRKNNLKIFYNSVTKQVKRLGSRILQIKIISRSISDQNKDCRSVDQTIKDWYSTQDSIYYKKNIQLIKINNFLIQGSQYGDVLALSKASFMQGTQQSSTCGQSIVFGFLQQLNYQNKKQQSQVLEQQDFSLDGYTTQQIWRYRRLLGKGLGIKNGQISLQNWNGPGNDYNAGYLFISKQELDLQNWYGGLNFQTLKQAQKRSLDFHQWFKNQSKLPITINKQYFKTCSGISRLPYIRDGRRSIGYKGFYLKPEDVTGKYYPGANLTAQPFYDRISIGMYNMDLHGIKGCQYDQFPTKIPLPFFIPLRALSNKDISNFIPIGRSIAQQFFVSSATRTPTTQIGIGASSMIIVTYMIHNNIGSVWQLIQCRQCILQLQNYIRDILPLQWTINGKKYPVNNQIQQILVK